MKAPTDEVRNNERNKLISEASQALAQIIFDLLLVEKESDGGASAESEIIKSNKQ